MRKLDDLPVSITDETGQADRDRENYNDGPAWLFYVLMVLGSATVLFLMHMTAPVVQ